MWRRGVQGAGPREDAAAPLDDHGARVQSGRSPETPLESDGEHQSIAALCNYSLPQVPFRLLVLWEQFASKLKLDFKAVVWVCISKQRRMWQTGY